MLSTLKKGDAITMFCMSGIASTAKLQVIFDHMKDNLIIYKGSPRKRKLFQRSVEETPLIFLGHDLPIGADSDGSGFIGNACYNLVSEQPMDEIRKWIEENNLQENVSEKDKGHFMLMTREQANNTERDLTYANCMYPDTEGSSMVNSIRDNGRPKKAENPRVETFAEIEEIVKRGRNGADAFYQHMFNRNFVYTSGFKEYMVAASCFWLSDTLSAVFVPTVKKNEMDTYYLSVTVTPNGDKMNRCLIRLEDYQGTVIESYLLDTDHLVGKLTFPFTWDGSRVTVCLHAEN